MVARTIRECHHGKSCVRLSHEKINRLYRLFAACDRRHLRAAFAIKGGEKP